MSKVLLFLFGFGLTVIGFTFIITYLNLTTMGYSYLDYLKFIIRRIECIFAILGIFVMNVAIYKKEKIK